MAKFLLERLIRATPADAFAASLDPALHIESMARYGETMTHGPTGRIVDRVFMRGYMRRLIDERNSMLQASLED